MFKLKKHKDAQDIQDAAAVAAPGEKKHPRPADFIEEAPVAEVPESTDFYNEDRRSIRRKSIIMIVALVIVTVFSLTLGFDGQGTSFMRHYSLTQVAQALWLALTTGLGQLFGMMSADQAHEQVIALGMYYDEMARFGRTILVLMGGMLIAVAGMLFQLVFRNPIASPTILGVNSGVQIGQVAMIVVFGAAALGMHAMYFVFSFVGGIIVLAIVFVCGIVTSNERGTFEIKNMLLAGVMVSQVLGVVITIVTAPQFSPQTHDLYTLLTAAQNNQNSLFAITVVGVMLVISMIPIVRGRFKYNLLTLSEEEMRVGGLDPMRSRSLVLACGSLMILAAQSALGTIAVISLVVPFIARAIFGVEFRKQLVGCVLIGMLLVMCCYVVAALIPFVGSGINMSVIANVVLVPLYAWIVATNQQALRL